MRIQSNWYSWDDVVSTEMMYESLRDPFKWKYSNIIIVQNPLYTYPRHSEWLIAVLLPGGDGFGRNLGHALGNWTKVLAVVVCYVVEVAI